MATGSVGYVSPASYRLIWRLSMPAASASCACVSPIAARRLRITSATSMPFAPNRYDKFVLDRASLSSSSWQSSPLGDVIALRGYSTAEGRGKPQHHATPADKRTSAIVRGSDGP